MKKCKGCGGVKLETARERNSFKQRFVNMLVTKGVSRSEAFSLVVDRVKECICNTRAAPPRPRAGGPGSAEGIRQAMHDQANKSWNDWIKPDREIF